ELRVEDDRDRVGLDRVVAAAEDDGRLDRLVALDADVERLVVPEDAEAGRGARPRALVGWFCRKPSPARASAHEGSSSLPSIWIGPDRRAAASAGTSAARALPATVARMASAALAFKRR